MSFDRFLVNNRGKRRLMGKRHVASTLKSEGFLGSITIAFGLV